MKDHGVTGNFEIKVNSKLVHSKRTKGHGFLHTNADQIEVVLKEIEQAMAQGL